MPEVITRKPQAVWAGDNIPPILEKIYTNRGLTSLADLPRSLRELMPWTGLLGIEKAAARLVQAVLQDEEITVVGDFDADGATATVVSMLALRSFGAHRVNYQVPNRFDFGYGLSAELVEHIVQTEKPAVILTVDNGIASHDGVTAANNHGIDVIITDHHLPPPTVPDAWAIVNPNQVGDEFPSKNLAGVGVAFYLMLCVRAQFRALDYFNDKDLAEPNLAELLDLVAIGTIADVVPLDVNNRLLVSQGLQRIVAGWARPGVYALLQVAKRDAKYATAEDISFGLAPLLNAAGRLVDIGIGIDCLDADDLVKALPMAEELRDINQQRRQIESKMLDQAQAALDDLGLRKKLPQGVCLYDPDWHQGVVGIIASRVVDSYQRPALIMTRATAQELKGSARSVAGVHIRDVLVRVDQLEPGIMVKFGGHAMAAGVTILECNFARFAELFNQAVGEVFDCETYKAELLVDGELASDELNLPMADLLQRAGPWGNGFEEPCFYNKFTLLSQRIVGEKHLQLVLGLPNNSKVMLKAIAFNVDLARWPDWQCQQVGLAYRLRTNRFRGQISLQLLVMDLQAL